MREQFILQNAIAEYFKQYLWKRLLKVAQSFEKKLPSHLAAFEGIDPNIVRTFTLFTTNLCLLTNPDKIGVDMTDEPSVFMTLVYPDKNAYLECFFDPGKTQPVQVNINIYENKKAVFAYSGDFMESLKSFLEHIPPVIDLSF